MDKLLNSTDHCGQVVTPLVDSCRLQLVSARDVCQRCFAEKPHILTRTVFCLGQCFTQKEQRAP